MRARLPDREGFAQRDGSSSRTSMFGIGAAALWLGPLHGLPNWLPEIIAAAIAEELTRPVAYRAVETDGAARAAARIAELL